MDHAGGWIDCYQPRTNPTLRLFCFPHAGGAAQLFRLWPQGLPEEVEVCPIQLPGRWTRLREQPYTRLAPLVRSAHEALLPSMDLPFALFGHSLGALVAFELARLLRATNGPLPRHLFVSGRRAPQLPNPHPPVYALPENRFVEIMSSKYGGIPPAVVREEELMQLLLPILRADMEVFDTYEYRSEAPLDCAITALGGTEDPNTSEAELAAWAEQTTAQLDVRLLPGDHFFIQSAQAQLLEELSAILRPLAEAG